MLYTSEEDYLFDLLTMSDPITDQDLVYEGREIDLTPKDGSVHNWANHLPFRFCKMWDTFSLREKIMLYIVAERAASEEEWD